LFIVVPKECQQGPFDSDSYRLSGEEIEKYLKQLKVGGQCRVVRAPAPSTGHLMDL